MRTLACYRCGFVLTGLLVTIPDPVFAQPDSAGDRLHTLFQKEWDHTLRESPMFASSLGDRRYNNRWDDRSAEAIRRRHEHQNRHSRNWRPSTSTPFRLLIVSTTTCSATSSTPTFKVTNIVGICCRSASAAAFRRPTNWPTHCNSSRSRITRIGSVGCEAFLRT